MSLLHPVLNGNMQDRGTSAGGCCRRYAGKVAALRGVFSEYGLIRARVLVEVR